MLRSLVKRICQWFGEPLVQFLVIGLVIYSAVSIHERGQEQSSREIRVDSSVTGYLRGLFEARYGFLPDQQSLDQLIENFILDEVLYREALKLGLAREDEIIRQRLIQKMRFLMEDSREPEEPDEQVLKAYFEAHRESFTDPVRLSFRHVYYSPEQEGLDGAAARAARALAARDRKDATAAFPTADAFPLADRFTDVDEAAVVRVFGDTPLSGSIFAVPPGIWSGPYRSGYGWHLVYVQERRGGAPADFGQVRQAVLEAYRRQQREEINRQIFEQLLSAYTIVREG